MINVITEARKKLLSNNFTKLNDTDYKKSDFIVRVFPDFTIDAYNEDYYWGGSIYDVKIDDLISDINEFIQGR